MICWEGSTIRATWTYRSEEIDYLDNSRMLKNSDKRQHAVITTCQDQMFWILPMDENIFRRVRIFSADWFDKTYRIAQHFLPYSCSHTLRNDSGLTCASGQNMFTFNENEISMSSFDWKGLSRSYVSNFHRPEQNVNWPPYLRHLTDCHARCFQMISWKNRAN